MVGQTQIQMHAHFSSVEHRWVLNLHPDPPQHLVRGARSRLRTAA